MNRLTAIYDLFMIAACFILSIAIMLVGGGLSLPLMMVVFLPAVAVMEALGVIWFILAILLSITSIIFRGNVGYI